MWERNINQLPPARAPARDKAHNPGMCPEWETDWRPLALWTEVQRSPTSHGLYCILCPFILSIISIWVILWNSAVTSIWWRRRICAELLGHLSACPYLPVSKLPYNGFCYILWCRLPPSLVWRHLFILVAITPWPHGRTPSQLWDIHCFDSGEILIVISRAIGYGIGERARGQG